MHHDPTGVIATTIAYVISESAKTSPLRWRAVAAAAVPSNAAAINEALSAVDVEAPAAAVRMAQCCSGNVTTAAHNIHHVQTTETAANLSAPKARVPTMTST